MKQLNQLRVYARSIDYSKTIEFAIISEHIGGFSCADPLIMKAHKEGDAPTRSFTLTPENAQFLMDDLWRCGCRPIEGLGSIGQLDATKYHLEDMRTLVFKGEKE